MRVVGVIVSAIYLVTLMTFRNMLGIVIVAQLDLLGIRLLKGVYCVRQDSYVIASICLVVFSL